MFKMSILHDDPGLNSLEVQNTVFKINYMLLNLIVTIRQLKCQSKNVPKNC